ncbi:GntR family transcriptional regulator [Ktedonobacteria bacterium brp13]|nr:GntR family transcriptional regulator [Ktedonobacteria bacterium brp13]
MSTPLLILDQSSPVPPYEQIRTRLRILIATGQLRPGVLLPSVRQLARDLNVAPNTIARAYSELEHDGWVITAARRGVIVAEHSPELSEQERRERLAQAISELLVTAHQLGASHEEIMAEFYRQTQP